MQRSGFTLTETLIVGALLGLFLLAGTLILSSERARTRDAKRMADITRIASGFAILYAEKASYASAATGCSKVGADAATCTVVPPITTLDAVKDPGQFAYLVSRVPDKDDFGVTFHLEKSYGSLTAGLHTLSRSGIR